MNDFNGCAADIGIIQGYYKTRYIPGSVKLLSDFEEGSSYNSQIQFYFCCFLFALFVMEHPLTVANKSAFFIVANVVMKLFETLNGKVSNFSIQEWHDFNSICIK